LGPVVSGSDWVGSDDDDVLDDEVTGGVGLGLGDPFDEVQPAMNATITTNVRNRHPTAVILTAGPAG